MALVKVAEASALAPGQCKCVPAGGRELALYNVDGEFFCTDNLCPHREGPLSEGELEDDVITCPLHAWQINVRTGEAMYGMGASVETFPVTVKDGAVYVEIE
jgi:nitrite reductase/ring-hydroxylating ferredoxin subunit